MAGLTTFDKIRARHAVARGPAAVVTGRFIGARRFSPNADG
jgi:hypothetical protein